MNTNAKLDSWDAFTGSFLKASHIKDENTPLVCTNVELFEDDDVMRPRLHLELNDVSLLFDLNKTNAQKCIELGVEKPNALIGLKIYFKKVVVTSPKSGKEVDSLRITKIGG